ncbi:MAG: uroporphyrinogen-III C-methyltransferase [Pirellulales bacterium]
MTQRETGRAGKVFLVGAGPGDPGLITLRGIECLAQADLVLYDYLVNPRILDHVPKTAEKWGLGHHGGVRSISQAEINEQVLSAARQGKTVVRLKGGDPAVFAKSAEETEVLSRAGIEFEIVPGVTAGLAAASYAGVPITHHRGSSAVALVTGQERHDKPAEALDYAALAGFPGTLVFYMGVTTAPEWTAALIRGGKSPATPAMIVRRSTWPDQLAVACTLGTLAAVVAERKIRPPAIVIVGDVVSWAPERSWFASRPLAGRRVLVTRSAEQAGSLRDELAALGADVCIQPAIEISPPADWQPVDEALARLPSYDWLVFSSVNGVRALLDRLCRGGDLRRLGRVRLAAIGSGTADELARYHLLADFVPREFRAESLAAGLAAEAPGRRFLLARASRGREVLAEELTKAGGTVDQIVVYQSTDVSVAEPGVAESLAEGKTDWITVTSSAIARALAALFGENLRKAKLVSISPITSGVLQGMGFEPAAEATEYTMSGVVEAILRWEREHE